MQRYGGNLTHARTVDIRAFPHPLLGTGNQHERARPTRKLHESGKQKYPCAESAAIYQALFRAGSGAKSVTTQPSVARLAGRAEQRIVLCSLFYAAQPRRPGCVFFCTCRVASLLPEIKLKNVQRLGHYLLLVLIPCLHRPALPPRYQIDIESSKAMHTGHEIEECMHDIRLSVLWGSLTGACMASRVQETKCCRRSRRPV